LIQIITIFPLMSPRLFTENRSLVIIICILISLIMSCKQHETATQPSSTINPCNFDTTGYRYYRAYQYDTALFFFGKTLSCYSNRQFSDDAYPRWYGKTFQYIADTWYAIGNMDSALRYYTHAARLYLGAGDSLKYSENLNSSGICYAIQGIYDSAEWVMKKAIEINELIDDPTGLTDLYQNMGIVCSDQGKIEEATDYYFKAIALCESSGDSTGTIDLNKCVADMYLNNKDTLMAEKYLNKALDYISSTTESVTLAGLYCSLGEYAFFRKQYTNALSWFNKLLDLCQKTGYSRGLASAYSNLASYWRVMKNYDRSVFYHEQAIDLDKSLENTYGVIDSQVLLAVVYCESGKYSKAILILREALKLALDHKVVYELPEIYKGLYENSKARNEYNAALYYHELYVSEKEKLSGVEMQEKIRDIEARYENEKARRNIEKLNQRTLLQQQKIRSREHMLWLSGGLLMVIVVLSFLIIRQHKLKTKVEKLDMEQRLLRAQLRPHFIFNVLN